VLASLSALPSLRILDLDIGASEDEAVASTRDGLGAIDLSTLAAAASLRHLRIDTGGSGDIDFVPGGELPQVESLRLSGDSPKDLTAFNAWTSLRSLAVWRSALTSLRGIERYRRLEELSITNARVLGDISAVAGLPALRGFEIENWDRADRTLDLTPLASLPALAQLKIRGLPAEQSFAALSTFSTLERLDLHDLFTSGFELDEPTPEQAAILFAHPGLTKLGYKGIEEIEALRRRARSPLVAPLPLAAEEGARMTPRERAKVVEDLASLLCHHRRRWAPLSPESSAPRAQV
jgi:hypothetical protein